MKLSIISRAGTFILCSLVLSSCRYIDWAKEQLPQTPKVCYDEMTVRRYMRSLHLYDQFDTLAHFEVLWLSDEVRSVYAQVYAEKHGLSEERFEEFERRQLEENNHYISFYVLIATPEEKDSALGEKCSTWTIYMKIDCDIYQPVEIKQVELCPEYELFFGWRMSRFKKPYIVRFDAQDIDDNDLIDASTKTVELWFRKADRVEKVRWYLTPEGKAISEPAKENNGLAYDIKPLDAGVF